MRVIKITKKEFFIYLILYLKNEQKFTNTIQREFYN